MTKRQFLRAAGLTIASRILPPWSLLRAQEKRRSRSGRRIIVVTFGGGCRYAETFAPEGLVNIPRLAAIRPRGYFYSKCVNSGILSHFNATSSLITGNWQWVNDFGAEHATSPTIFETWRKATGAGPIDTWVVASNKGFARIGASGVNSVGSPYGANVVLPKLLLTEAIKEVVRRRPRTGVTDRETVQRQLEGLLTEDYEGVGWTIFKTGQQMDAAVQETLTKALIDYIHGPGKPSTGDELTYFIAREVMREFTPRVLLVNFWDMDVAHWGSYSLYLRAIQKTDELTGRLWDEVQANPHYRDKTTMLVVPELGRDGDMNAANGFLNHRSGDPSCRNVWALAVGGGLPTGETDRPISHVDICATAAALLELRMADLAGEPLPEVLG
ncbi:MAG: hypothetical protein JWP63_7040 [Candidatus Solibacter sp.]|jgi:hypothetical protein|nr:hypothetical protein [Candidatus Solibacter sp.]